LSPRQNRISRNEELFREVNARIAELEDLVKVPGELLPLICECANTGCTTLIQVEPETFQAVREHPLRFLVAHGHEGDESVVDVVAGYSVVEIEA
jgi:hypothetical protein